MKLVISLMMVLFVQNVLQITGVVLKPFRFWKKKKIFYAISVFYSDDLFL